MSSVAEVFHRVKSCFVWRSDEDSFGEYDHWADFAAEVYRGEIVQRDCEDFALTCLIVGIEQYGWDRSKCRIARVLSEVGRPTQSLDHAVAIYDGQMLDNRQRVPLPLDWPNYRWYDYCEIPMGEWRLYEGGVRFNEKGRW